jgi:Na+/proline symporter
LYNNLPFYKAAQKLPSYNGHQKERTMLEAAHAAQVPTLAGLDLAIVIGFLVMVTAVGYFMSNMASQGIEDYFLGNNKIPWWVLGISTATSNFDMTGTMIIVAMVYDLGYRGYLVELRGGVGLSLAFLMIFLGKWLRRSRVMTSAQWMKIRFGTDKAGQAAHILSAVAQSLLSLGMIIYFCVGGGKFLEYFLPWDKDICTAVMVAVGLFYTLLSGLYGVVFTDVIQMIILSFTAIYLAVKGFNVDISSAINASWLSFDLSMPQGVVDKVVGSANHTIEAAKAVVASGTADATVAAAAQDAITKATTKINEYEALFRAFGVFVFFYLFKCSIEGMAGVGGYTDQRFFAAKNEREAGLLTLESIVISILRWAMVAGLVALGIWMVSENQPQFAAAVSEITADSEKVLPAVIGSILPVGIKGVVLAGLIAAAMSTFDSTLNAGASYLVVDIYHSYINPKADMKQLVRASHIATIALAAAGVVIAMLIPNINTIWDFITMALSAGMFMPLFLRWYWPRYNGWGFAWGTGAGMIAALIAKISFTSAPLYFTFPSILLASFVVSVVASLMTAPVEDEILTKFFVQVNPFGFWHKYAKKAVETGMISKEENYQNTIEKLNDMISLCLAVPFQFCILLGTMALIFHDWSKFSVFTLISIFCGIGLYFFWFKNLKSHEQCDLEDKKFAKL